MKTNTMGGDRPRNEGDAYYTPDALAQAICGRLREAIGNIDLIVEPSAGEGAFVRAAGATWEAAAIIAVEANATPESRLACLSHAQVYVPRRWEDADQSIPSSGPGDRILILGNPPYNLPDDGKGDAPTTAERHVTLALERLPPGGHVAFLLRLAFLSGGGRTERLHSRGLLRALWPVTPRPSFTGGGTDGSEYGVFVWCKGWTGLQDVRPLVWDAPKRGRRAA